MADVIDTAEFRNGLKILVDGAPFEIVEFQHVKPGKGSAFVRTRIRNLLNGRVLEPTFKSGDKVERPDMEEKEMQYLFKEGEHYVFMDTKTFDQSHIDEQGLGPTKNFLKENENAKVLFWNGRAITVQMANAVELKITKCDPGVRGDTVSGAMKPATLETGYTLQVPLFVNEGDILRIDTRTGAYITRVG
jgi:elongation factor P